MMTARKKYDVALTHNLIHAKNEPGNGNILKSVVADD